MMPFSGISLRALGPALLALATATPAVAQVTMDDIPLDNLRRRWFNWDIGLLEPILFSPGRQFFYAINQPGARIALIATHSQNTLYEIPTGPGLVSIKLSPDARELWYVDRVSSSVGVIEVSTARTIRTVRVGAAPHGIVFSASGDRAFITCSGADRVDVIRTSDYRLVNSIPIPARMPRGIVRMGDTVYVTSFMSGNGTATRGANSTDRVNEAFEVRHVEDFPALSPLPDRDLFAIPIGPDVTGDSLDAGATITGLGTNLYNLHQRPGTTELWIPHTEALNGTVRGEKNFVEGQVTRNRIAVVDPVNGGGPTFIDLDNLAPTRDERCSIVTAIAFTEDGSRAFVCGFGSDSIAVLDVTSPGVVTWAGVIHLPPLTQYPEGTAPRGLALGPNDRFLLTLNRADNTMTRVVVSDLPSSPSFVYQADAPQSLGFDPVPGVINRGLMLHNRTQHSKSNTSSCVSCHIDGHTDGLVWDLSGFLDPEGTPSSQLSFGTDVKGPLVTQSGRRLKELGPYHWRGEKKKLKQFDAAFPALLEHEANGEPATLGGDFLYIAQYFEHLSGVSNPRQPRSRVYSPEQLEGADIFLNKAVLEQETCASCHPLPLGTIGEITPGKGGMQSRTIVVPQLRGVGDKTLSPPWVIGGDFGTRTELGAGLGHGGTFATIQDLLLQPLPAPQVGQLFDLTTDEADKLTAFLLAFDTGFAPSTGFQVTAHEGNASIVEAGDLAYLVAQAEAGHCDLVFRRGPVHYLGRRRILTGVYDPAIGKFHQASSSLPNLLPSQLIAQAENGSPVTFLGVPGLMGWPMGVDRDMDKLLDLDEVLLGTDPEDPDTDGDTFPDGYERIWSMDPLQPDATSPDTVAPAVNGTPTVIYTTQHAIKFEFTTTEVVDVRFSYSGGETVLRAPFNSRLDDEFSVVIAELDPNQNYAISLELTDAAGNVTNFGFNAQTAARALPVPVRIEDIELMIIDNTLPTLDELDATVRLGRDGSAPIAAGYVLSGRVYHESDVGVLTEIDTSAVTWPADPMGVASFRVDVPASIRAGSGQLYLVIEAIEAAPNEPPYVEADDLESLDTVPY